MRRVAVAILLSLAILGVTGSVAQAQGVVCPGVNTPPVPVPGYTQATVNTSAVSLTIPARARFAVVVVETNGIRYRDDGTDPTSSVGTPVNAVSSVVVCGSAMGSFRMIRQSASSLVSQNFYE